MTEAEINKLRNTCRVMARKLAWWTIKINHESADEDTVADAGNDFCHALAVLEGLRAVEDIDALRALYPPTTP